MNFRGHEKMENKNNLLNEKELEQVSGGMGGGDPVEPGNWYIHSGGMSMAFDPNTTEEEYFYCKSAVGNGEFLFAKYVHRQHYMDGNCISDEWTYQLDLVLAGVSMSKTCIPCNAVKI